MESKRKLVGSIQEEIQLKHLSGDVKEYYIKTCRGKLAVSVIDPFTGEENTVILKGDVTDPTEDRSEYRVSLYTDVDLAWFKQQNHKLIARGLLVPDTPEVREEQLVNVITDDQIEDILSQPFFSLKNKIDKFTSPVPVERFLRAANQMNKAVGTIKVIEERLAELQEAEYTGGTPETNQIIMEI